MTWGKSQRFKIALALMIGALMALSAPALAAVRGSYVPGVVLVGFKDGTPTAVKRQVIGSIGAREERTIGQGTHLVRLAGTWSVPTAAALLRRSSAVRYAEADYIAHPSAAPSIPNDPSFGLQWGRLNLGQSVPTQDAMETLGPGAVGTPGADDKASWAWRVTTGSRAIVVGVADTGIDYHHPDLASNVWSNPGGIGGCPAGTHGYDAVSSKCDPIDQDPTLQSGNGYGGHGTHVSGIIGAVGNNGIGVAGMNWKTSILAATWYTTDPSSGSTADLIGALDWLDQAKRAGVNVRVINVSLQFDHGAHNQSLIDEINKLGADNILLVTAAGNYGHDNDNPNTFFGQIYPCNYDLPSELCVTATDDNDRLPSWADYGPGTVDLAAPGQSIYSTLRDSPYAYLSGSSMATAEVSAAAALILSREPALSMSQLKARILSTVDRIPSLKGKVRVGGRLNVCKAVRGCMTAPLATANVTGGQSLRSLQRNGLGFWVQCDLRCGMSGSLLSTGRHPQQLGFLKRSLPAGRGTHLSILLNGRGRRTLARARSATLVFSMSVRVPGAGGPLSARVPIALLRSKGGRPARLVVLPGGA